MPKVLCMSGMVIAILILVLFLLDLAVAFPFRRINAVMDITFVLCALALGYLSWSTLREQD
ncbi:MAG: hypothetical protein MUF48_07995 [Pirellulaceae bacterium]|nr:hypothetical protein [Pirellulaceae bacterium]